MPKEQYRRVLGQYPREGVVRRVFRNSIEALGGMLKRRPPFLSSSSQEPQDPFETAGVRVPRKPSPSGLQAAAQADPRKK
jgi:hypothetical protein